MGLICSCPLGAEISDITISACPESLGQVQKAVFQRLYASDGVLNEFVMATADPKLKASWDPLLAAADNTKAVQTPYIQAPTSEAGAARTYGGGNETLGGVEINIGREPSTFTGKVLQSNQLTIKQLKEYQCENVGVFLIDEYGRIGAIVDDIETPTTFRPIPLQSLFVGDKVLGGLEAPDSNEIMWKFLPNWSDDFYMIEPTDFNALTELVTP